MFKEGTHVLASEVKKAAGKVEDKTEYVGALMTLLDLSLGRMRLALEPRYAPRTFSI